MDKNSGGEQVVSRVTWLSWLLNTAFDISLLISALYLDWILLQIWQKLVLIIAWRWFKLPPTVSRQDQVWKLVWTLAIPVHIICFGGTSVVPEPLYEPTLNSDNPEPSVASQLRVIRKRVWLMVVRFLWITCSPFLIKGLIYINLPCYLYSHFERPSFVQVLIWTIFWACGHRLWPQWGEMMRAMDPDPWGWEDFMDQVDYNLRRNDTRRGFVAKPEVEKPTLDEKDK